MSSEMYIPQYKVSAPPASDMSPKHLQLYVNEFCFRLNDGKCDRHIDDRIKSLCGFAFTASHMTYKQLLAKQGSNLLMRVA